MDITNIKIWFAVQLLIDFLFVFGIIWYLLRIRREFEEKIFKSSSSKIKKMMQPFLSDAEKTSSKFDYQIKEKKRLIRDLNDTLDTRISNLTFLINRADNVLNSEMRTVPQTNFVVKESYASEPVQEVKEPTNIERRILELYEKGYENERIAKDLGITIGEVSMIISLRKKFNTLRSRGG